MGLKLAKIVCLDFSTVCLLKKYWHQRHWW